MEMFLASKYDWHPTKIANLHGARCKRTLDLNPRNTGIQPAHKSLITDVFRSALTSARSLPNELHAGARGERFSRVRGARQRTSEVLTTFCTAEVVGVGPIPARRSPFKRPGELIASPSCPERRAEVSFFGRRCLLLASAATSTSERN